MVAIIKFIISATLLTSASAAAIRRQDLPSTSVISTSDTTSVPTSVVATTTAGVEEVSDPVLAVRPVSYSSTTSSAIPAEITGTGLLGKLIVGSPVLAYRT